MYTYEELLHNLQEMEIDPKGTLLVHSSMKSIGAVEGGADTVLKALCDYMQGGLLVFPTHTWSTVNGENPVYDVRSAKSCVGLLTNQFLKLPGVVRSLHPTHSVAALGKGAEAYIKGEEAAVTPCPQNGCWGRLYENNATILFIGCRLNRNTYIHSVEEWCKIPDRLSEGTSAFTILDAQGKSHTVHMHRHACSFTDDVSQNYIKLEPVFAAVGAMKTGRFGAAECRVCSAKQMGDVTKALLNRNPALLSHMAPVPEEWYRP